MESGKADVQDAVNVPYLEDYLNLVPPPVPFDLIIDRLSVGVPSPSSHGLSKLFRKAFPKRNTVDSEQGPAMTRKTIVRDVSATCRTGHMLAM